MGLDTSHDCWHGAYSAFMRWRSQLCIAAGLPPLEFMEGFYGGMTGGKGSLWLHKDTPDWITGALPIHWDCLKPDILHELLYHSDCDGELDWTICGKLADRLTELLPKLPEGDAPGHIGNWQAKTQQFIDGLREAYAAKENVEFR